MTELSLKINGCEVKVSQGATLLEAAIAAGVNVPTLCHHPELKPAGQCRLCVVEIAGRRGLPESCTTEAEEGMEVFTDTLRVKEFRQQVLGNILQTHEGQCISCPGNQQCELQVLAAEVMPIESKKLAETDNPFFRRDYRRCIQCGRCVRMCHEIRGAGAVIFREVDGEPKVGTAFNLPLPEAGCQFCAACVDVCPTGALSLVTPLPRRAVERASICPYCGVGCSLIFSVVDGKIAAARPDPAGPANKGQACVKGRFGIGEYTHSPERLTAPLVKKNGAFVQTSWDEALDQVAAGFKKYKPEEVAVISSAKTTNEDNYVAQKFARAVLKTNSVDHCARLCHAPTVAGLARSFGSGAMTNTIEDIAEAKCVLAIGSNTSATHPVTGTRIRRAVMDGAKLIVANPIEIPMVKYASIFLQQRPGTDLALIMGMVRVIVEEGLTAEGYIKDRCENYDEFCKCLDQYTLDFASKTTGVPAEKIQEAACIYAQAKPASIVYSMGITQHSHGTENVLALGNLALLTGNVGVRGGGVNPLRGQNNVQGACDMAALPNVYPGYQQVADEKVREKFEKAWGVSGLSPQVGLPMLKMMQGIDEGKIKALYLIGENPAMSEPDIKHVKETLKKLELFVAQDIFQTESTPDAHVVLAAQATMEKDGTFTNSERRVQLLTKVVEPVGDSRPDWWITSEIAKRMDAKGFNYSSAADVLKEINQVTPSYAGITRSRLEEGEQLHWPCPAEDHPGTPILHTKTFTRGKGFLAPIDYKGAAEQPDDEFPFVLTTDRSLYQFHTSTMSGRSRGLKEMWGEQRARISPSSAKELGVADGDKVKVTSRRGEATAKAMVTPKMADKVVAMDFHFAEANANLLTNPTCDPVANIPEFKACAVRIEKI